MTTIEAIRLASVVTAINVLVASGFPIVGIIRPQYLLPAGSVSTQASLILALYAAARTIPLALFALWAIYKQSTPALLILGALAGGFFDKAMALCETMPKPVIAAISGTALAGAFEFTLACDIRIAEDGDYLIGLPETELGLPPGASGTQRLPRTIGPAAALMHILMGRPLNPREAEKKGLVHETVSGKAIDRAMEIAKRFRSHTPDSLGYIKRLVRNAIDTPLAEGLTLERSLFMRLCVSDQALI
jgi:hypothetical protein